MVRKRAATVSLKNLSAAVEKAARNASEKNKVQFAAGIRISPTISGKVARPPVSTLAQAEKLATDITKGLTTRGGALAAVKGSVEPAVLVRGGVIICGFISPEGLEFE